MNRLLEKTSVLLVLACCFGGTVFGGLLPGGGNSGYRYDRPNGGQNPGGFGGFGRPFSSYGTPVQGGFGGNEGSGNRGSEFGGGFGGSGGNGAGVGFSGRPSGNYGTPGFGGGNIGFQGNANGGRYQDNPGNGGYNYNDDNGRPKPYSFQYEVRDPPSGNDYSQQESSDGNAVRGEYRVLLPDSRTQIVRYTADDASGYNAEVQYEGQAQFPRGGNQNGGYNLGGPDFPPGAFGRNGGYPGGAAGGGSGNGFGGGSGGGPNNQYLPAGVDYGK